MDDFYNKIKNITNDNIDELCNVNLSEKIENMGIVFFDSNAQSVINDYLNVFGNVLINHSNKEKLADFLIQSMENDKRIEINMWEQINFRFNVGNINVFNSVNISELIKYFLIKIDISKQSGTFLVKIYILAYIHENNEAKRFLSKKEKSFTSYQEKKFIYLYNAINYAPIYLSLDQTIIDDLLLIIGSESKLTPFSQPTFNYAVSITQCYNLKEIQKKAKNIEEWENVLDFLVFNGYITVRNQTTYDMTKNFGNTYGYIFPDEEVLYYVMALDDIVNHNGNALIVLNVWGTEYLTYNLLPKKVEMHLRKQEEYSSNLEKEQNELNQLQQQLKENQQDMDKMSEQLEKSMPSLITIVSLIVAIIPFVTTNINFIGNEASRNLVLTVNGCLLLAIAIIYALVNYIILDKDIDKKVCFFLIILIAAVILIA